MLNSSRKPYEILIGAYSELHVEDVVDWEPHARIERDYGSNLGGPVAASGLPGSISEWTFDDIAKFPTTEPVSVSGTETGPPPTDATITDVCNAAGM